MAVISSDPLFLALVEHAQLAQGYLAMMRRCRHAIKHNDHLVRLGHDVVWFAVRAFRDAAVMHLFVLYDTNGGAISVRQFLEDGSGGPDLAADVKSLSRAQPDVKALFKLRNNAFGHRNRRTVARGREKSIGEYDVTDAMLDGLLSRATKLLRKYGGLIPLRLSATPERAVQEWSTVDALLAHAISTLAPWGDHHEVDGDIRSSPRRTKR